MTKRPTRCGPCLRCANVADRCLPDERTSELVRFVFVWRGKLMSDRHLFEAPLERICEAARLTNATGKPTITMHRFRHTLDIEGPVGWL
jgi:hypothetical protein